MPLKEPTPANDRGFMDYGGGEPVVTDYGHQLRVRESSAATRQCVWIFIDGFPDWYRAKLFAHFATSPHGLEEPLPSVGVHLTVRQAVELMGRLDQFLDDVTNGSRGGADEVNAAKLAVYGR